MERSPASIGEISAAETPLPVEMTDNQLFYAEGMESISINEAELNILAGGESEIYGIDLVNYLGEGFLEDYYPIARSGFDYQMAWYDFNRDGKKELIFAGGDKHTTLICSVFQLEIIEESLDGQLIYELKPGTILEIREGVRAYVNDNNEICVVDTENNFSKLTVPL